MSAYEQKVEPPDRKWQYLLFAAEPYETIAFKVRILSLPLISELKFYLYDMLRIDCCHYIAY
jgi:splicing factor 3A subunit 2